MDFDFNLINENSFWAVPLVVAITEVFKMTGFNAKYAPMISLVIGLAMSFLINIQLGISQAIISGIIYGLSASGLYSQVKATANIRGRVPLRTNEPPVYVEEVEIHKPLNETSVKANENIQVTETVTSTSNPQAQTQVQPQQTQQQAQQQNVQPQEVKVEEMNVNVDRDPLK